MIKDRVSPEPRDPSELPARWQSWVFQFKAALLRFRRGIVELGSRPPLHSRDENGHDDLVVGAAKAKLWTQLSDEEFPLTAGKVENLRVAAKALHGLVIPAGIKFGVLF